MTNENSDPVDRIRAKLYELCDLFHELEGGDFQLDSELEDAWDHITQWLEKHNDKA